MPPVTGPRRLVVDLAAVAPVWRLPPWAADALRAGTPEGWEACILDAPTVSDGDGSDAPSAQAMAAVREAEAYVGFGMPPALLAAAPELRWVHTGTAGVGSLRYPEMRQRGPLVTNSAGVHAVPIAEFVLAGVLHFLRGLDVAAEQQRAARWDRAPFVDERSELRELGECQLLVVGTGGIGTAVAERASALGASCVGLRRHPDRPHSPAFARVAGLDALDDELPTADILVLAVPLTDHTRALMTAERLDRLPPGAIVVNVARGALVDEAALAERLAAGALRGAVLDVYEREPLPPESPLWGQRRALVTPHVSGVSPRRFWEREVALILDNWSRYRSGAPLRNLVDLEAGY